MWDVPACTVCQRIAVVDKDPLRAFPPVFLVVTNRNKPCQQLKRERNHGYTVHDLIFVQLINHNNNN